MSVLIVGSTALDSIKTPRRACAKLLGGSASHASVAASFFARLLHRYRWIGYIGLVIVLYVALHMMWEGHRDIVRDLGKVDSYNAIVPNFMAIQPDAPVPVH